MATAQSPNDLTRQQLDELDALLQKMLAMPLNPPEGTPSAPNLTNSRAMVSEIPLPEMPQPRPVSPPPYSTPVTSPFSVGNGRENNPPVRRTATATAPATTPQLLVIPTTPPSPVHTGPNGRAGEPAVLPITPDPRIERRTQSPTPPNAFPNSAPETVALPSQPAPTKAEPLPAILAPLVMFNSVVNFALGQLGIPGRILRSSFGKNLIALTGIALLAYTAAKVAQTQGWATFPIDLPWPS